MSLIKLELCPNLYVFIGSFNYLSTVKTSHILQGRTLDFRIVVLALIIVLAGNFPKFNNRPVPNKRTGATFS